MIPDDTLAGMALKFIGSASGSVLALVFLPPKSLAEFVSRTVFSLISGVVFADPAREYIGWADTWQMQIAAATAVALLSWFVMGAVVRVISMWKPKE